jgi:hypothetical protein
MTTFYGFLDDSGDKSHDDRIFLCGYIAGDETWEERFSPAWGRELPSGISAIHATELLSCSGHFYGWTRTAAEELAGRLVNVIRTTIPVGIAVGLDAKHYRTLRTPQRNEIGQPELILMSRAIQVMAAVVEEARADGQNIEGINVTFDDSDRAEQMLRAWLRLKKDERYKHLGKLVPSIGFGYDEMFYPLQAADLLANLTRRYWQRKASSDRAEEYLRQLLTHPDEQHRFAYRLGFVVDAEMDKAVRLHRELSATLHEIHSL